MPVNFTAPYKTRVKQAVADPHLSGAVTRGTVRMDTARINALAAVDGQRLRDQVRQMKSYTLRHLPELLEQLERNLVANGARVHWAKDAAEANRIISAIAEQNNVRKVVKAKSMATEEIHLNKALEKVGIEVVETDLGEYIIQLAGEAPSHIVAPVMHKRIQEISELFQQKLDMPPSLDPAAMCTAARRVLRKEFLSAEMGVSGCNFAIAETGTVCIVTNEGNGRMISSMPKIYVALMGIEKLVPTVEDAFQQYQLLCRSATGQNVSVYMSMTSGPKGPKHPDGPEQFHVVLMDNGRLDTLARGYGEALLCIRCGACLNTCPVYRQLSGHAYGSTYSGPIGSVITPLLSGLTVGKELPHASTLCGACREACPVKIDLPRLLVDLRADLVAQGDGGFFEKKAIQAFVQTVQSRQRFEQAGKVASVASNLAASMMGGNITFMPPPLYDWTRSRDFPPFAKKSFRDQWKERKS